MARAETADSASVAAATVSAQGATAAPVPANVTLSTSGAHVAGNGMVPAP